MNLADSRRQLFINVHLFKRNGHLVGNLLGGKFADRWLTVRDIYALRLRAKLVTLSACDTGRAVVGSGDELVGLVRGFFAAGAASLLLSLWLVNDESGADQMARFYDAWRRGATKPAALRAAQLAHLTERPHPAFWAPFEELWSGRLGGRLRATLEYRRPIDLGEDVRIAHDGDAGWLVVGDEVRAAAILRAS